MTVVMRAHSQMNNLKLITKIIQSLTERETEPCRYLMDRYINRGQSDQQLRNGYVKLLSTVQVIVAHASVASSESKVQLDSHAYMSVVGNNCLVIHSHYRQVNIYSNDTMIVTEVPRQVMLQEAIKIHRVDRSLS